jgi:hypothetical protein
MTSLQSGHSLIPLELEPIGLKNAKNALRIAWDCFGNEAAIIALTYAWHGLRHWLPVDRMMASSGYYSLSLDGRSLGSVWCVTSVIHGSHVCWLDCNLGANADWTGVLPRLLSRLAWGRCAIIRLARQEPSLEAAGAKPLGRLPGPAGGCFWLYLAPAGRSAARTPHIAFHRARRPLGICAQFHMVKRSNRPIGITGLYMTSFWPGLAFGGWGALRRKAAQRHTALALLAATEQLACLARADWFLIETSDAPAYRAARRAYEWYGLDLLLEIPNFFSMPSADKPGEAYLVFGRPLRT